MPRKRSFLHLSTAALALVIFSINAAAQDDNIWNEYRGTATTVMPITEKVMLWQYTGFFLSPERKYNTTAVSPPGIVYRARPWLEIWAGILPSYTDNYHGSNSWELRPILGIRTAVPNKRGYNLYNFARYEYKLVNQDHNMESIPRFRNRVGIDIPLAKGDRKWSPGTMYTISDIEPIWRLDDKYLEKLRLRGGVGYVINKRLAAELIYHAEWAAGKGDPKEHVGDLWRVNFKISLPKPGIKGLLPRVDIDD